MVETFMANPYLCTLRLKGREGSGYLFNLFWNIFGGSESRTFMWGQCWLSRTSTGLWKLGNSSGLPGISLAQSREKTKQNLTTFLFACSPIELTSWCTCLERLVAPWNRRISLLRVEEEKGTVFPSPCSKNLKTYVLTLQQNRQPCQRKHDG